MAIYLIYCKSTNQNDNLYEIISSQLDGLGNLESYLGVTHPRNSWLISTDFSELEIWNYLKDQLKPKDKLIITELSPNWKGRFNEDTKQWIKQRI